MIVYVPRGMVHSSLSPLFTPSRSSVDVGDDTVPSAHEHVVKPAGTAACVFTHHAGNHAILQSKQRRSVDQILVIMESDYDIEIQRRGSRYEKFVKKDH